MTAVIPCVRLLPLIDRWRAQGGKLAWLTPADQRFIRLVQTGGQETTSLDRADRFLIALDLSPDVLNDLAPLETR